MKIILVVQHFLALAIIGFSITAFSQSNREIKIIFSDGTYTYPEGDDEITLVAFPDNRDQDSLSSIIRKEFSKYPQGILEDKAFLKTVIVCGGIYTSGNFQYPIYGTYLMGSDSGNCVIMDGSRPITQTILHHELSSILLYQLARSSPTFIERNKKLEKEFDMLTDYFSEKEDYATKNFTMHRLPNNNIVLGWGYAMDSFENDLNTIMEYLFAPKTAKRTGHMLVKVGVNLWEFLDIAKSKNYPVYQKVKLAIDYYHSIHPAFTEQYFRKLEVMDFEGI